MSKAQEIEQQIEYSKKQASSEIDEEIKKIKKHLYIIRTKRLTDLEQEIYKKNMLHKMLLNKMEKKVIQDLYTDSHKIKETISNYLFDKI
jgi:formate dehydrogenase maturation protein FdhE